MTNLPAVPDRFASLQAQANALVRSGFLPSSIKTADQAIMIMMMGEALGIKPVVALTTINVINGKPTIPPQMMLAFMYKSRELTDLKIEDDGTTCNCTLRRNAMSPHTESFSMSDAAGLGLSTKDNWKKQPKVMRKWRAVAAACRVVFPDLFLGFYTPEEMGADVYIDENENMYITPGNDPADLTVRESAIAWAQGWAVEHNLGREELLAALNASLPDTKQINAITAWTQGRDAANESVKQWLADQLNAAAQEGEKAAESVSVL